MAIASHTESTKTEPTIPALAEDEVHRRNRAAIVLLDAWEQDLDERDQQETMQVIRDALGRNRSGSSRALFP